MMQCFIDNGFQGVQLVSINRCCLYLQVIHLSDITTDVGYRIDKLNYTGSINTCLHTECLYPVQGKLGNSDWIEWRKSTTTAFFVGLPDLIPPISYQLNDWDEEMPNVGTGDMMKVWIHYITASQINWHGNIQLCTVVDII